jgi:hypothetical protein
MARPHICFVQAQCLPWVDAGQGLARKVLGVDENPGPGCVPDSTELLRLAPGFDGVLEVAGSEELFVLEGGVEVLGDGAAAPMRLLRHGYTYAPAPLARRVAAPYGAVLLRICAPPTDAPPVSIPDTFALPWRFGAEGSVTGKPLGPGIASKALRLDPRTGEQSFLYCALPQHPPPPVMVGRFTHPVVEEIFVLEGSYVFGDVGRMGPGGYVYWREGEWHGPAGSETGYHLFIRVVGGPLRNAFSAEPAPFDWHPPYRPVLPEPLRAVAREYQAGARW